MTVSDGPARLACYDREMRRIEAAASEFGPSAPSSASAPSGRSARSTPSSPSGPSAPSGSAAPPAASPEERFGLPPDAGESRTPSRIAARVATATRQSSGRYIITLENGEVWLQTEDRLGFMPRPGGSVSIKRGLLGSYWMTADKFYVVAVRRLR